MTYVRPKGGYRQDAGFHVLVNPELCIKCNVKTPVANKKGPMHPSCNRGTP